MTAFTKRPDGRRRTSRARRLNTGSSGVDFCASSLRSSARSQPPCTNVSLPSGRTSLTVACRSTFGFDDFTHTFTAPAPSTVTLSFKGAVTYEAALPAGGGSHLYGGVAVQSPPSPPAVSPVKSVGGRAFAFHLNASAPARDGFLSARAPLRPKNHERPFVPGAGNFGNDCS